LDHDTCLETTNLKGTTASVRAFAEQVQAERGVRFAKINLVSVNLNHDHAGESAHRHDRQAHLSPHRG
jgi:CopG family nickel-responsive transcriptional regulator